MRLGFEKLEKGMQGECQKSKIKGRPDSLRPARDMGEHKKLGDDLKRESNIAWTCTVCGELTTCQKPAPSLSEGESGSEPRPFHL